MKGFIGFGIAIILVVAAGIYLANRDPIGVEVAKANADLRVGGVVLSDLQQGFTLVMKWLLGASVATVVAAVFVELRKLWRIHIRDVRTRRWRSGPNARWQQQAASPRQPNLSRTDLILMTLLGRQGNLRSRIGSRRTMQQDPQDEELDIDF